MRDFGVSFSLKYAEEMGISPEHCLEAALKDLKIKRLRLMSYWDLHEPKKQGYDFSGLDWQFELAKKYGARVTLSIGLRQPRWPENHWPAWTKEMPEKEWQAALLEFIQATVLKYRNHPALISWQLENEALLKTFGQNGDYSRERLNSEFKLVRKLDSKHPIIMTTSDSWGIPVFGPTPDIYGFSVYRYFYDRGRYRHSRRPALYYRIRALLILLIKRRSTFIHELQAEPWGPKATVNLSLEEQVKSMNIKRIKEAICYADKTKLYPIDVWGLEWWYWLKVKHNQSGIWELMKEVIADNSRGMHNCAYGKKK